MMLERRSEARACYPRPDGMFSVQYHSEASPGPQDSFYLFEKFVGAMK